MSDINADVFTEGVGGWLYYYYYYYFYYYYYLLCITGKVPGEFIPKAS